MSLRILRSIYFAALFASAPFLFACMSREIGPRTVPRGAECQLETRRYDLLGAQVCQTGVCENRVCVDHCNGPETGDPANGCQVDRSGAAQVAPPAAQPAGDPNQTPPTSPQPTAAPTSVQGI